MYTHMWQDCLVRFKKFQWLLKFLYHWLISGSILKYIDFLLHTHIYILHKSSNILVTVHLFHPLKLHYLLVVTDILRSLQLTETVNGLFM